MGTCGDPGYKRQLQTVQDMIGNHYNVEAAVLLHNQSTTLYGESRCLMYGHESQRTIQTKQIHPHISVETEHSLHMHIFLEHM